MPNNGMKLLRTPSNVNEPMSETCGHGESPESVLSLEVRSGQTGRGWLVGEVLALPYETLNRSIMARRVSVRGFLMCRPKKHWDAGL